MKVPVRAWMKRSLNREETEVVRREDHDENTPRSHSGRAKPHDEIKQVFPNEPTGNRTRNNKVRDTVGTWGMCTLPSTSTATTAGSPSPPALSARHEKLVRWSSVTGSIVQLEDTKSVSTRPPRIQRYLQPSSRILTLHLSPVCLTIQSYFFTEVGRQRLISHAERSTTHRHESFSLECSLALN